MTKLISVIIPVKNGSNYVKEAIDSVFSQGVDLEVIVVDDGSTDNTARIARDAGCLVISHPACKGQVAAKNTGLGIAKGEYVMFLDHDDVLRPGALKELYEAIESDPSVSAVEAKVQDYLSPEISSMPGVLVRPDPYFGLFTGAILIRRSAFDVIGKFSENINTGEIFEWASKMDQNHLIIKKIDLVSTDRRIHLTNYGRTDKNKEMRDYAAVLRAMLRSRK